MQNGIKTVKLLKVGFCRHPEFVVNNNRRIKPAYFPATCVLIEHVAHGFMLFDTGYAPAFFDATQSFPESLYRYITPVTLHKKQTLISQLAAINLKPEEIQTVIISHFHADHIAGLGLFTNAQYICSRDALTEITQLSRVRGLLKGLLSSLLPDDFSERVKFIDTLAQHRLPTSLSPFTTGKDIFNDGTLSLIDLPGHAKDHQGLLINRGNKSYFFIADACWDENAFKSGQRPNKITHLILDNTKHYINSINKLSLLHQRNPALAIIPAHCEKSYQRYSHELS